MIEHLGKLAIVEAEVECHSRRESDNTGEHKQPRVVAMAVCVERIIADLIPVWLVVRVGLIDNAVGVRIRGEDVLVADLS